MKRQVRVVPMTREHLDEVAALERACFPDPWSRRMLAEELDNAASAYLVALDGESGGVVGYAGLLVVADEGYITNVAARRGARASRPRCWTCSSASPRGTASRF